LLYHVEVFFLANQILVGAQLDPFCTDVLFSQQFQEFASAATYVEHIVAPAEVP
jgi:hypothetical protein